MKRKSYTNRNYEKIITEKKERLQYYKDKEKAMMDPSGVQSYTIGPRSLTRYSIALADIHKMIDKLESEITELEYLKYGGKQRRAVGVVPRDNW